MLALGASAQPCDSLVQAAFEPQQLSANAFVFNNTSWSYSPPNTTYYWTFGDGTQQNDHTGSHTYTEGGVYQVCLYAIVGNCVDTTCQYVQAGDAPPACTASMEYEASGADPDSIHFFPTGTPATSWLWSFGDGAHSDLQSPWHQYAAPGAYYVCLTTTSVVNGALCTAEVCDTVVVQGASPCDGLDAGFSVNVVGHVASFQNAMASNNYAYSWQFGDGSSGMGPNPVHTYAQAGTYHVCLLEWTWDPNTQDTCFAEQCEWITVEGASPCDGLNAGFDVNLTGNVAHFINALSSNDYSYYWNFGDGSTGIGPDPVHEYGQPGTYHACLTMWTWDPNTQDTCFADHCAWVTVSGSPCDGLNADFSTSLQGHVVTFTNAVVSNDYGYTWHFGDGTSADGPNAVHNYAQPGTYHACLLMWAWDPIAQDTCYADHCTWITIADGGSPCDSLSAAFTTGSNGGGTNSIYYSAAAGPATHWLWSFGDGTYSDNGPQGTHTYPAPGPYEMCLHVWMLIPGTQDTCDASFCQLVMVGGASACDSVHACFTFEQGGPEQVFFGNCSTAPDQDMQFVWHFGDGTNSTEVAPDHTYTQPGTYNVCLVVYWHNCETEYCHAVDVIGGSACDSLWTPTFEVGHENGVFIFHNTSDTQGQDVHVDWSFGDGHYGSGSPCTHVYEQGGVYTACMTLSGPIPGTQDSCSVTTCSVVEVVLGVPGLTGAALLHVAPVPFTDALTITGLTSAEPVRITLLDMAGRVVRDASLTAAPSLRVDYGQVASGTYVLRVRNSHIDQAIRVTKE